MSETRAARIAAALRAAIQDGQYAGGERLIELHLAQQFGVSQTLIREALALLEQEGWVSKQERRGVFVRTFTPDEIRQIIGLAAAIEAEILRGWMARPASTQERALAGLRAHWQAALIAQRDDPASAFLRLLDLHEAISQPGTIAAPLHRSLINQLRLIELHTQAVRPRPIWALDAHMQGHDHALAALRQGDPDALPEALRAVSGDYLHR
ncbi:MAG: GntR family transcriptional regulator [Candidatus Flexifilum sp.]|jgi:DNA-binding GntR family transcriptional regulator